jgi:hypothetical protein
VQLEVGEVGQPDERRVAVDHDVVDAADARGADPLGGVATATFLLVEELGVDAGWDSA